MESSFLTQTQWINATSGTWVFKSFMALLSILSYDFQQLTKRIVPNTVQECYVPYLWVQSFMNTTHMKWALGVVKRSLLEDLPLPRCTWYTAFGLPAALPQHFPLLQASPSSKSRVTPASYSVVFTTLSCCQARGSANLSGSTIMQTWHTSYNGVQRARKYLVIASGSKIVYSIRWNLFERPRFSEFK